VTLKCHRSIQVKWYQAVTIAEEVSTIHECATTLHYTCVAYLVCLLNHRLFKNTANSSHHLCRMLQWSLHASARTESGYDLILWTTSVPAWTDWGKLLKNLKYDHQWGHMWTMGYQKITLAHCTLTASVVLRMHSSPALWHVNQPVDGDGYHTDIISNIPIKRNTILLVMV
jgi:hypothetical protein